MTHFLTILPAKRNLMLFLTFQSKANIISAYNLFPVNLNIAWKDFKIKSHFLSLGGSIKEEHMAFQHFCRFAFHVH